MRSRAFLHAGRHRPPVAPLPSAARRFRDLPESQLATMEGQGYVSTGGVSGVLGYVYANSDSDGDTLIDGFERLASTDPHRADSDCDGAGDGQELLQFGATGYGDPLMGPGCALASQFVSQSVPTTMKARRVYSIGMSFKTSAPGPGARSACRSAGSSGSACSPAIRPGWSIGASCRPRCRRAPPPRCSST